MYRAYVYAYPSVLRPPGGRIVRHSIRINIKHIHTGALRVRGGQERDSVAAAQINIAVVFLIFIVWPFSCARHYLITAIVPRSCATVAVHARRSLRTRHARVYGHRYVRTHFSVGSIVYDNTHYNIIIVVRVPAWVHCNVHVLCITTRYAALRGIPRARYAAVW